MLNKELIELLSAYPPDAEVAVDCGQWIPASEDTGDAEPDYQGIERIWLDYNEVIIQTDY